VRAAREGVAELEVAAPVRAARSITVRRPIEEVFQFLADPSRLASWDGVALDPGWTTVPAAEIGAQYEYEIDRDGRRQLVTSEVIAYEPPSRLGWFSYAGAWREITRITLERDGDSTVICLRRLRVDAEPCVEPTATELDRLLVALRDELERGLPPVEGWA